MIRGGYQGFLSPAKTAGGLLGAFVDAYALVRLRFTRGFLVAAVVAVMTVRYVTTFLVGWFHAAIGTEGNVDERGTHDARVDPGGQYPDLHQSGT